MTSGIYKILNILNGKFYIGSAVNLSKRWSEHKWKLSISESPHTHLQFAWNKYGAENFKFEILEIVKDWTILLEREQWWIDQTQCFKRELGYNFCPIAGSALGTKQSEETKIKCYLAKRKFDKWPHADGFRCKCEECKEKQREYWREQYWKKERFLIKEFENYVHGNCKNVQKGTYSV